MGGTFDPIHSAHLLIGEAAREEYGLDRVIFMTGGNPPHKTDTTPAKARFTMTRLAISDNPYFTDDDYETEKTEKSYTVHTLEYLKDKYPNDDLFFIIGEDSLRDLPVWYKPEEILSMCTLLVFPRVSRDTLADTIGKMRLKYGDNILPIDAPVIGISSTDIRDRISKGKTIKYMLPDKVIEYIKENNLYGKRD